jgi:hypothetical protein
MSANQASFPIAVMARVLGVSESGFHARRKRPASAHAAADTRDIRGAARAHAELRAGGERHGRKRIARLMREARLVGASRRRNGVTTTRRDQDTPHVHGIRSLRQLRGARELNKCCDKWGVQAGLLRIFWSTAQQPAINTLEGRQMDWAVQESTWTANNRYPGIFRTVQGRVAQTKGPELGGASLKILSFGCSSGNEISTLRSYFPEATIYGCDVNEAVLHQASQALMLDEAVLFRSTPENIRRNGPYDLVFAMSVLCRFPESRSPDLLNLSKFYSFNKFADGVGELTENLSEGGIICLYNLNYSFGDLAISKNFRQITSALIPANGFVDKFDRQGGRLSWCEDLDKHFVHRLRHLEGGDREIDFVGCLFEKSMVDRSPVFLKFGLELEDGTDENPPDLFRFGPDLGLCLNQGLVGSALAYWYMPAWERPTIVKAWYRSSPSSRRIEQGRRWAVLGGAKSWASLHPPSLESQFKSSDSLDLSVHGRASRTDRLWSRLQVVRLKLKTGRFGRVQR